MFTAEIPAIAEMSARPSRAFFLKTPLFFRHVNCQRHGVGRVPAWQPEMLKIETRSVGYQTILKVIGRLQSENLPELAAQIAAPGAGAILDMDEVTLVDVEVVRFLNQVESSGTLLRNCPAYIREWMTRERERTRGP